MVVVVVAIVACLFVCLFRVCLFVCLLLLPVMVKKKRQQITAITAKVL